MTTDYSNSKMQTLIDEYIHSERDRQILRLRMIDGQTYEQIAEAVCLSSKQVYRIITREAAKLYKYL